jgi:hypothetical protein
LGASPLTRIAPDAHRLRPGQYNARVAGYLLGRRRRRTWLIPGRRPADSGAAAATSSPAISSTSGNCRRVS